MKRLRTFLLFSINHFLHKLGVFFLMLLRINANQKNLPFKIYYSSHGNQVDNQTWFGATLV